MCSHKKSLMIMHLVLIIRLLGCIENDNAYGAYPQTQRLARKCRRRGTNAAGVLLLRQGIRDNAYGALSAAFPPMHILEDKI